MENEIAPQDGTVASVSISKGRPSAPVTFWFPERELEEEVTAMAKKPVKITSRPA